MSEKKSVGKYASVVVDIDEDLKSALTQAEKAYYDKLSSRKQERFLHMAKNERSKLMSGEFGSEEELVWQYGSSLALRYINEGWLLSAFVDKFVPFAGACLLAASLCFGADVFFNVYAKNRQDHVETLGKGATRYEIIPEVGKNIDAGGAGISNYGGLMTLDQYGSYLSRPGFRCGDLKNIDDSFYADGGVPLCRKNSDGDVYVAGYALNPKFPIPTFNVIHKGKLYNVDLSGSEGIQTGFVPGVPFVTLAMISRSFQKAFPEAMKIADDNVVQKEDSETINEK